MAFLIVTMTLQLSDLFVLSFSSFKSYALC